MISISASKLRNNLFEYLGKVSQGETIGIKLNGKEVGKIIPLNSRDWRQKIRVKPKLNKTAKQAFAPLEGIWEKYE